MLVFENGHAYENQSSSKKINVALARCQWHPAKISLFLKVEKLTIKSRRF
jgi:hypothetical protein